MKAAYVEAAGARPIVKEIDPPKASPGNVVVDVVAAGLGPTDVAKAAGSWRPFTGPHVINGEGVGRLDTRRVYFGHSVLPFGAAAEQTLVEQDLVWPIDDAISDEMASVIGYSGIGGLVALETAGVRPGDRVLINGATSTVGQVALQVARSMGAGFVAAAGRNLETLKRLAREGLADAIAQIGQEDDVASLKTIAGPGWDVVVDIVFGAPGSAAIKTTAKGARIVILGALAGRTIPLSSADVHARTLTSVGTNDLTNEARRSAYERLAALVVAGRLKVPTRAYRLDQIGEAWDALQGSANAKIIVRP